MTAVDDPEVDDASASPGLGLTRLAWIAVLVVCALVVAGGVGWLIRGDGGGSGAPGTTTVDAGFARDMSTHHRQAITMAGYERDNTSNSALKVLAYDIETEQLFQVGEMQGWLDVWHLPLETTQAHMVWMGPEHAGHVVRGLMPGMATPAQLNRLESLHGKALDVLFLQLMIHHHQGGLVMAKYAQQHASEPYVRDLADSMVVAQSNEIIQMEQSLRQLGGKPLPPPQT